MAAHDWPALNFLPAFEAAGRKGSFKAAAAELHLSPSAISQQIKGLEDGLGVALFERRGRAVVLTAAGEHYFADVRRALLDISRAGRRVRRTAKGDVLQLSSIDFVVYEFVMPRLSLLRAQFPSLELQLRSDTELVDFEASELDGAIRVGGGPWPGLVTHPIGSLTSCVVCSPDLARRVTCKSDIFKHTLIEQRGLERRGWHAYLKARGRTSESVSMLMVDSHLEMLLAAEQGLGLAYGLFPLASTWLASGRIAVPFSTRVPIAGAISVVHRPGDRHTELFETVAQWLRQEYARLPALPDGRVVLPRR